MQTLTLNSLRNVRRVLASSAVLLALSILLPTGVRAEIEMTNENGTNRPGNDYRHFEIVPLGPSIAGDLVAQRCREACEADSKCGSWTAVKPGIQSPKNGVCWLKGYPPNKVADSCCTSGIKIIHTTGRRPPGTTGPAGTSALGSAVVSWAVSHLNQCVTDIKGDVQSSQCATSRDSSGNEREGPGECTHLVHSALVASKAKPPVYSSEPYVWGDVVSPPYQPGDVIQLYNNAKFDKPGGGGHMEFIPHHTAIIEQVQGQVLKLVQQNAPDRKVTRGDLDLSWTKTQGSYVVYRPKPI